MIDLPTLGIIIGSAAIDSINPYSVGVLILIVSVIMGSGHSTKKLLLLGGAYIFGIFITYLVAGLGLVYFFSEISIVVSEYLSVAIGVLLMLAGILEIKDYFWYGKGFSLRIPTKFANTIHDFSASKTTFSGIMLLGAFVAAVGLPFTGAPYLAVIAILRIDFNLTALGLMTMYSFIFILPLIIILFMIASGTKISSVAKWKEESKGTMRLFMGLLLALLAWILILISNGTVNFG